MLIFIARGEFDVADIIIVKLGFSGVSRTRIPCMFSIENSEGGILVSSVELFGLITLKRKHHMVITCDGMES